MQVNAGVVPTKPVAASRLQMLDRSPRGARSPYGWWVASYIERLEWSNEDRRNPRRRCLAWENTVLVKATNRDQAYRKAMAIGRQSSGPFTNVNGRVGKWRFEGLTSLLPIYDKLEHGAEILWVEHENRTIARIRRMVKRKLGLECFDGIQRRGARGKAER